jgi:hypothetical protein
MITRLLWTGVALSAVLLAAGDARTGAFVVRDSVALLSTPAVAAVPVTKQVAPAPEQVASVTSASERARPETPARALASGDVAAASPHAAVRSNEPLRVRLAAYEPFGTQLHIGMVYGGASHDVVTAKTAYPVDTWFGIGSAEQIEHAEVPLAGSSATSGPSQSGVSVVADGAHGAGEVKAGEGASYALPPPPTLTAAPVHDAASAPSAQAVSPTPAATATPPTVAAAPAEQKQPDAVPQIANRRPIGPDASEGPVESANKPVTTTASVTPSHARPAATAKRAQPARSANARAVRHHESRVAAVQLPPERASALSCPASVCAQQPQYILIGIGF